MGYFLAVSAFQNLVVEQLVQAIQQYTDEFGVTYEMFDQTQVAASPKTDAIIFAPVDRWIIVVWPEHFNIHDFPICEALSGRLSTLASTIHVYDGDYWVHGLFENGKLLDQFCTQPDYFADDSESARQMKGNWQGNPEVIASRFNVSVDAIRGYLLPFSPSEDLATSSKRFLSFLKRRKTSAPNYKVNSNDEFGLDTFWVFTDFWRRLGIQYPDDMIEWTKLLRLSDDFTHHLPYLDVL